MKKTNKIIPYGKHYIDDNDIRAVEEVLRYQNLTQGKEVEKFEKAVAKFVGAKYAVAVSSWTSGLHLANLVLGVMEGDKVVTSPITFVATSNSVLYCGAKPVFSDIDSRTINICPEELENTIIENPSIKVIIPVHFAGLSCDMESINRIAKKYDLYIIEDAAHALGAQHHDGSMVGSCKYSDMTGFSFHPVKSIAAGEGGMITTNNYSLYKSLLRLRSHGINKLDDGFINKNQSETEGINNPWYYEMQDLGFNFRITDIQCALGLSQLQKLDRFIDRRRKLVEKYDKSFKEFNNLKPAQYNGREISSHHLYVIRINFNKIKYTRASLMNKLKEYGILCQVHYIPVTSQPYYSSKGYNTEHYTESQKFYNQALSIPLYFSLTDDDQEKVIKVFKSIVG
jgi:perosamine synthetase